MQFFPLLMIPLVMALYRPRYSHGRYIFFAIGWYALAKALEHFDGQVYAATGALAAGHALKHLAAAAGCWVLVRMFTVREPL